MTKQFSYDKNDEIAAYFADISPDEGKSQLESLREIILATSDEITEKIAWGVPTYYYLNKYLVQISKVKNGIAFYTSEGTKLHVQKKLKGFKQTSKNSLHFPLEAPISPELIQEMVEFRMKEKRKELSKKAE